MAKPMRTMEADANTSDGAFLLIEDAAQKGNAEAMFLLAHIGNVPVLGLPGCVMYHKASIFDMIVPRLLAGVPVSRADIAALGHGGYCSGCPECRYPLCGFGKY